MSAILEKLKTNPVLCYAVLAAALTVAAAFGVDISDEQRNSLLAFAAVLLGGGVAVRSAVTPNSKLPVGIIPQHPDEFP